MTLSYFLETWKNKDESSNKEQKHDQEMIRDTKRSEVEQELRKQVDVLMREELDLLKVVSILCDDRCHDACFSKSIFNNFQLYTNYILFNLRLLKETREKREKSARKEKSIRRPAKRARRKKTKI